MGVPASSINGLLAFTNELVELPLGHSRRLQLRQVPCDLPQSIAARREHCALLSLRIGTAVDSVTRIQIERRRGFVKLSPERVEVFRTAVMSMHDTHGDLLIAGDGGLWTDRLWFWPLEA
jgi:hypothetical protein